MLANDLSLKGYWKRWRGGYLDQGMKVLFVAKVLVLVATGCFIAYFFGLYAFPDSASFTVILYVAVLISTLIGGGFFVIMVWDIYLSLKRHWR